MSSGIWCSTCGPSDEARGREGNGSFRGAFLVPAEELRRLAGEHRSDVSFGELVELKRHFRVSLQCLVVRLGQTGILSEAEFRRHWQTCATTDSWIRRTRNLSLWIRSGRIGSTVWRCELSAKERFQSPRRPKSSASLRACSMIGSTRRRMRHGHDHPGRGLLGADRP